MSPSKHEDEKAVWVKHRKTGTVFMAGMAQVEELGDAYMTIAGPDDHTEVSVKSLVKAAVKGQTQAQESDEDPLAEVPTA